MLPGFFNLLGIVKRWRNKERESFQRGRRIDSQAQKEADEMRRYNRNVFPRHLQTFRLQSVRPQSLCWYVEPTMWTSFCITVIKLERLVRSKDCFYFERHHTKEQHTLWSKPAGPRFQEEGSSGPSNVNCAFDSFIIIYVVPQKLPKGQKSSCGPGGRSMSYLAGKSER